MPPYSRTFANPNANIRPIFGINDVSMKIRAGDKDGKDAITDEITSSHIAIMKQNNIQLPSKPKGGVKEAAMKDRNIIIDKKTKRKVKMEGMYGISRAKNNEGENGVGSYSDLLEGIPLTDNSDEEVSNGTDKFQQHSEVMFPYDSMSDTSKTGDKSDPKNKFNRNGDKISSEKDNLCISEESMDLKDGQTRHSPDKGDTKNDTNGAQHNSTLNNDLKLDDKTILDNGETGTDKKFKFSGMSSTIKNK